MITLPRWDQDIWDFAPVASILLELIIFGGAAPLKPLPKNSSLFRYFTFEFCFPQKGSRPQTQVGFRPLCLSQDAH
jgi:hypothetical protein